MARPWTWDAYEACNPPVYEPYSLAPAPPCTSNFGTASQLWSMHHHEARGEAARGSVSISPENYEPSTVKEEENFTPACELNVLLDVRIAQLEGSTPSTLDSSPSLADGDSSGHVSNRSMSSPTVNDASVDDNTGNDSSWPAPSPGFPLPEYPAALLEHPTIGYASRQTLSSNMSTSGCKVPNGGPVKATGDASSRTVGLCRPSPPPRAAAR